jgi:putative ABC transport system permease protein
MTATVLREAAGPLAPTLAKGGTSWRPLVRLALRDLRRRKGRTALVSLMIGIPVAVMLLVATAVRTGQITPEQRATFAMGQATSVLYGTPPADLDLTDSVTIIDRGGRIGTEDKRALVSLLDGLIDDPIFSGKYEVRSGRLPSTPDEVAVSSELGDQLSLSIGDSTVIQPGNVTVKVVGVVRDRGSVGHLFAAVTPDPLSSNWERQRQTYFRSREPEYPTTQAEFGPPIEYGIGRRSDYSSEAYSPNDSPIAVLYTVGAVALVGLGLLIVAAFASGARRQLRELGLIAANGGDPRQIRRALALGGTVTGAVGVAVGYALFAVGEIALAPHQNRFAGHVVDGIKISLFDFIAVGLMGLAAATFAAWLPARNAARTPVLAALGGRAPLPPIRARLPFIGLALAALGLLGLALAVSGDGAWFLAAVSGVAILIGGSLCAPWLVSLLAGVAARFGGPVRLSARRIARHRARTGPLVAAIMAVIGGAIAVGVVVESSSARDRANNAPTNPRVIQLTETSFGYEYSVGTPLSDSDELSPVAQAERESDRAAAVADIQAVVPGAELIDIRYPSNADRYVNAAEQSAGIVIVAQPAQLAAAGAPQAASILAEDGYVVLQPDSRWSPANLKVHRSSDGALIQNISIDPRSTDEAPELGFVGWGIDQYGVALRTTLVLSDTFVEQTAGLTWDEIVSNPTLVANADLTDAQRSALTDLNQRWEEAAYDEAALAGSSTWFGTYAQVDRFEHLNWARLGMTVAALLLALAVVAIGLTLSSVEQRDDEDTLIAIGAGPSLRRRIRAAEAGTLTAIGALLGLPLGAISGAIIAANSVDGGIGGPEFASLRFPWAVALGVCVALPLAAAGVTWLCTRTPRQVSLGATA